jgi:hypothetical protein
MSTDAVDPTQPIVLGQRVFMSHPPPPGSRAGRARPKVPYGQGSEAFAVCEELDDFDYLHCPAWSAIVETFGAAMRLRELKGFVDAIRTFLQVRSGIELPKLSRNAKRNLGLLVKYINEHYNEIVPVFPYVTLLDGDAQPIPVLDAGSVVHSGDAAS